MNEASFQSPSLLWPQLRCAELIPDFRLFYLIFVCLDAESGGCGGAVLGHLCRGMIFILIALICWGGGEIDQINGLGVPIKHTLSQRKKEENFMFL
jgi:hypothetical protein